MKTKYLLMAVAIAAIAGNLQAGSLSEQQFVSSTMIVQPPQRQQRTPEERAKRETDWMTTQLALTEKQIPAVDSINLKYAKKQSGLFTQMREQGGDFQSMRPKMQELQGQKNEELKLVLTEEQMTKYNEALQQRRGMRGQGGQRNQQ